MNNFTGSNLLGFTSIGLVFLFTLFLAKNNRAFFKVILTALIIRIILILIGHYITPLPDQTADALTFNGKALDMSQEGFINVISLFLFLLSLTNILSSKSETSLSPVTG